MSAAPDVGPAIRLIGRNLVEGSILSLGVLLATAALYLGLATAVTAYPAQPWVVASVTPATATVTGCSRTPFVSLAGVGRWWECDAVVRLADGTRRAVRTRPGVVSPQHAGSAVTMVATCSGPDATGRCSYTRPGSLWAQVGIRLVWLIAKLILGLGTLVGLFMAAMTVFRSHVLWKNLRGSRAQPDPPARERALRDPGEPDGSGGRVHVTFEETTGPWAEVVMVDATPRFRIDKRAVEVARWNSTSTISLPAGRHKLRVTYQWKSFTDRGQAEVSFDLRDGEERHFRYRPGESLHRGTLEEIDA
jgi:hypothetical protein